MNNKTQKNKITLRERINKRTMIVMVGMYCKNEHRFDGLCPECQKFLDYAQKRLEKCIFGLKKPVCQKCTVHCYAKNQAKLAKIIMGYSGPRIMFRHPFLAFYHIYEKFRYSCPR